VAVWKCQRGWVGRSHNDKRGLDLVEKQLSTPLNSALRRLVWLADPLRCRWMGGIGDNHRRRDVLAITGVESHIPKYPLSAGKPSPSGTPSRR